MLVEKFMSRSFGFACAWIWRFVALVSYIMDIPRVCHTFSAASNGQLLKKASPLCFDISLGRITVSSTPRKSL